MNYPKEAKEAVEPIIDTALKISYKRRLSQIYSIMGTYCCFVEEDFPNGFKYLEDALKISEELNDILTLFMANYWLGLGLCFDCQFDRALSYLEKTLEINIATNTLWGISALKAVMSYFVYFLSGKNPR